MIAADLIVDDIPLVKTSDSGNQALIWMETCKVSHLPIVNNSQLLGLISDKDIYDNNCEDEALGNHNLSLTNPFIFEDQHLFEIIDIVAKMGLSLIPVLKRNNDYLGSITLTKLVNAFSKMISVDKAGSIIILDMTIHDYSASEISQIIESNNGKILSMFVSQFDNSTQINVTLKIDVTDITSIVKTFDRYNYIIKASYLYEDLVKAFYESRYESFLKFLDI
jgi:acetoin utilization protein AcuB